MPIGNARSSKLISIFNIVVAIVDSIVVVVIVAVVSPELCCVVDNVSERVVDIFVVPLLSVDEAVIVIVAVDAVVSVFDSVLATVVCVAVIGGVGFGGVVVVAAVVIINFFVVVVVVDGTGVGTAVGCGGTVGRGGCLRLVVVVGVVVGGVFRVPQTAQLIGP